MLHELKELEQNLKHLNIPFFLLQGNPEKEISYFLNTYDAAALVSDFSPLRINRDWKTAVAEQIEFPFYEVDAPNIVPCSTTAPVYGHSPAVESVLRLWRPIP